MWHLQLLIVQTEDGEIEGNHREVEPVSTAFAGEEQGQLDEGRGNEV